MFLLSVTLCHTLIQRSYLEGEVNSSRKKLVESIVFRSLLKSVFQTMRKQLLDKFRAEKDKMPAEKRTLVLTHFPRFLSLLEEEIYSGNSPIWDPEFKQNPPAHVNTATAGNYINISVPNISGFGPGCLVE